MTPRDIEKLKALGCTASRRPHGAVWRPTCPWTIDLMLVEDEIGEVFTTEEEAWERCKSYTRSEEGMKATMADKVRWLRDNGHTIVFGNERVHVTSDSYGLIEFADQRSPEVVADDMFWKVP